MVEYEGGHTQRVLRAQYTKYNLSVLEMSGDSLTALCVDPGLMLPAKSLQSNSKCMEHF